MAPSIGFILDREGRSDTKREELKKESDGLMFFLPRRMYENYLLNPKAIACVISKVGYRESPVDLEAIQQWLVENRWNKAYFQKDIPEHEYTDDEWVTEVNGAKLLEDIFRDFTEHVEYSKPAHGEALTEWLLENAPDDLREIAELIEQTIQLGSN